MRKCPHCKERRSDDDFYPDAFWRPRAWCKLCINHKRGGRQTHASINNATALQREQDAILSVIAGHQRGDPFVYLIEMPGGYKIGFSRSVVRRVRTFNTAHPFPVRVVAVAPGGREVERALHSQFDHYRIAREWFRRHMAVLRVFSDLPGAMVFLPGHTKQAAPTAALNGQHCSKALPLHGR